MNEPPWPQNLSRPLGDWHPRGRLWRWRENLGWCLPRQHMLCWPGWTAWWVFEESLEGLRVGLSETYLVLHLHERNNILQDLILYFNSTD